MELQVYHLSQISVSSCEYVKSGSLSSDWDLEAEEDSANPLNVIPSFVCIFLNDTIFVRFHLKSEILVTADFSTCGSGGRSTFKVRPRLTK